METVVTKTNVLIVGAGPTGLALACQLIRYGIDFVIIDSKETTTPYSKAIGVQARTLEIYEQIGLADKLVAAGAVVEKVRLFTGGELRGEMSIAEIGEGMSPYPFLLIAEQGKHERLLYDFVKSNGKDVIWNTVLESFSQDGPGVTANVQSGGEQRTIHADYLVGCDGAKSGVRKSLGLKFEGSTFERIFYVADVEVDSDFDHNAFQAFILRDNLLVFFPMVGSDKHFRIVGTFPEEFAKDEGDVLYEEIEEQIKRDAELDLDITKVHWFSTYKVHSRHVERFSVGRCFLAGDSAHVHTPAGGQGMNTGIQDGYNLAWKLALVLNGKADEKLLETYNEERLPNARNLLRTTDRLFDLGVSRDAIPMFLRYYIFPYVANFAFSLDAVKRFIFPRISQIGISYKDSSLSEDDGGFRVKAGDRLPYFTIDGESIYDRLRDPSFHLLAFYDGQDQLKNGVAEYSDLINFQALPLYPRVSELFGIDRSFYVLLRPDNYVAMISADVSLDPVEDYLERHL